MLNKQLLIIDLCVAILLGASLYLSFPPINMYYVIFFTLSIFIFILEYSQYKNNSSTKFIIGYVFYFVAVNFFIDKWFSVYFRDQLEVGVVVSYVITVLISLYTALYIGLISYLYVKLKTKSLLYNVSVLFPSLWVLSELIRGLVFPRSWYVIGNTQVDNIIIRGWYPVLGVYFVSWLVISICGFLVYIFITAFIYKKYKKSIFCFLMLILFLIFSYQIGKISYTKQYGESTPITLVQPNIFSSKLSSYNHQIDLQNTVYSLVEKSNSGIIILPETVFDVNYKYLNKLYIDKLLALAKLKALDILFGSSLFLYNSSVTGTLYLNTSLPIYIKHFLVPIGEYIPLAQYIPKKLLGVLFNKFEFLVPYYTAGEYIQKPFELYGQKFSFNICYENSINDFIAQNAKQSTIIINQSDISWYGKTYMKDLTLQLSQVRALENQRYFLQDSTTGMTAIIDNHGVIVSSLRPFSKGVLYGLVQGYDGYTPFENNLNYPIWLICIISIFLVII